MKKKFTETQIVLALRQPAGREPITEIVRKIEIYEITIPDINEKDENENSAMQG